MDDPEISKAVTQLKESAFSEAQLLGYEKFWDIISTAKMHLSSSRREGLEKGRQEGLEEGRKEGRKKGLAEGLKEGANQKAQETARNLKQLGIAPEIIMQAVGLSREEIEQL